MEALGSERPRYNYVKTRFVACSRVYKVVPHRGLHDTSSLSFIYPVVYVIALLYPNRLLRVRLAAITHRTKGERNADIQARYQAGEPFSRLADMFGISEQRVEQIVHGKRK